MQREEMARLRVLSSNHWDLNSRDLPAALQGRQARTLEVDGLPNKPARLVHFHPGVGGPCALSNPSVNTASTERQPSGFEPAAFSISRPICYPLHTSPSLNWVPGNAKPARAAGFRAGRWENIAPRKPFLLPKRKTLCSMSPWATSLYICGDVPWVKNDVVFWGFFLGGITDATSFPQRDTNISKRQFPCILGRWRNSQL